MRDLFHPLARLVWPVMMLALFALLASPVRAQEDELPDVPEASLDGEALLEEEEFLPPTVNFVIRENTLSTVLHLIEQDLGVTLVPRASAAEQQIAQLIVRDASLDQLLAILHNQLGWQWYQDDSMPPTTYELYTDEEFRTLVLPNLVIEKSFYLENITSTVAAEFVQEMLSEVGSVAEIPRTNEIIVTDLPQHIEAVERLIDRIDVRLIIRVFHIRNADVRDVADALDRFRSPDGSIEVNERNHTIIVEDLYQNIRRMDLMVEQLDEGTVLVVYELRYLSVEEMDGLEVALESVITDGAMMEVDERMGRILIDDVPEVHERVAEIIAAYDTPTRQIMLQADIIQVRTSTSFNLNTEFALSGDLLNAAADIATLGIPAGSVTGGADHGYINLRGEFPVFSMGGGGVLFEQISSHYRALLVASLTRTDTRLLLSPRIQVKDGESATIDVGAEIPFISTTYNSNNTSGTRTFTQQAVRDGLTLDVTPRITNTGYVEMSVQVKNDNAEIVSRRVPEGDIDAVERQIQEVDTILVVPDGGTRVIAGLLTNSTTESRTGVPFLRDIPHIGWLFGETSTEDVRDNLMVFLTPTIIMESATDFEWRPHFDERPVSARYRTPMPDEPGPLYPPDIETMRSSALPEVEETEADLISRWLEGEDLFLMPALASLEESSELAPAAPPEPWPLDFQTSSPETAASPEEFELPLVDEDITASLEEDGSEVPYGVRTSYGEAMPQVEGSMPTTGTGPRPPRDDGEEEQEREEEREEERPQEEEERDEPPSLPPPTQETTVGGG